MAIVADVNTALRTFRPTADEAAYLEGTFRWILDSSLRDPRGFSSISIDLITQVMALEDADRTLGLTHWNVTRALRDYERHWTPVHLDFVVEDVDAAVRRATDAGAKLERPAESKAWGRIAILSDPFGHGFSLLELRGRGYGEVVGGP